MTVLQGDYDPAIQIAGGKYAINKLDTTSAASGDVPSYNGTTVVWTPNGAGGLSLPATATDSSSTTGDSFLVTESTLTSGNGIRVLGTTGVFTTGGELIKADLSAAVAGTGLSTITTGVYTGAGLFSVIANSATTGDLATISGTGLTTGDGLIVTGGGANMAIGGNVINANMGAATAGTGILVQTSGVYTGTTGVFNITASSATTGVVQNIIASGITSGIALRVGATAATLTTGRYVSFNDNATEVFGVGANGHLHSTVSAVPPTIAVTTQNGITAAAITAGGSDTCGIITTTGTSTDSTVLDVTFGKTYTTAPKGVILVPANGAAAMPNTGYFVSAVSATGFTITVATGGTYAATPSFRYVVIA